MKLTCRHLTGATLITVAGEVDAVTSAELEAYLDLVRRRLDEHLILDVNELSFLDSSGLAVLLAAAVLADAHGAGVHLVAPHPRVTRLLEITGAHRAVSVHDDVERAIAVVRAIQDTDRAEPLDLA
ncbi:STAS domain-containing protein [Nonomuraea sp. LPB2021202275-12-8]|uniref:STAS domain-containing protein n=1 Tax=Nonomuraea sp. LPB2021202275-12-8 TaxID=3120159 RepID=UPI00300CFEA1